MRKKVEIQKIEIPTIYDVGKQLGVIVKHNSSKILNGDVKVKHVMFILLIVSIAVSLLKDSKLQFETVQTAQIEQFGLSYENHKTEMLNEEEQKKNKEIEEEPFNDSAPVSINRQNSTDVEYFIQRFYKVAQTEQRKFNIPASISLAQGIMESSSGNSYLSQNANNYFGIKCFGKNCSKGHCLNRKDDHHYDRFKIYNVPWDCWRDHSLLLKKVYWKPELGTSPDKWAYRLKQKGYATSKRYAENILATIDKYNLTKYDIK